jgi:pimeloyl-ACP methyl ester carboxylesterase
MHEEKFINVEGIQTRYLEAGAGEPLVLFHGADYLHSATNADVWDRNIPRLAESFRVFAVDKLGMGYTANPRRDEDHTIGAMVRHAYEFLRAADLIPANIVGHSRGGYLVGRLAMEYPQAVHHLVIVDSNSIAPGHPASSPFYDDLARRNKAPDGTPENVRFYLAAHAFSPANVDDEWVASMVRACRTPRYAEMRERMKRLASFFRADIAKAKEETLGWLAQGRLKSPTLVVWGFNDPSAPIELGHELFKLVAGSVPRAHMHVLNQAGHHSFREQPEDFNRVVASFIRKN